MRAPTTSRFQRYFTVILRWLVIAVSIFALTVFSGLYITKHFLPKVYMATAQVQIRPRVVGPTIGTLEQASFQSDFEIMQSPDFLLPIIVNLELDKTWASRIFDSKDPLPPTQALDYVGKMLKFDVRRGTDIVDITVSSDVPEEAAAIANAMADRYKTMRDEEKEQRNRGSEALREQIARQQKVVDGMTPEAHDKPPELLKQQNLLDALTVRLKQWDADDQLTESSVLIVSRAEAPKAPSKPNKCFALIVTLTVAGFLSVMIASFVEVIFLFLRAAEGQET